MKKLLALSFIGTSFFITSSPLKADWDHYAIIRRGENGAEVYTVDSVTGNATLRTTKCILYFEEDGCIDLTASFDGEKLYFRESDVEGVKYHSYDLDSNVWEENVSDWDSWKDSYDTTIERELPIKRSKNGAIQIGNDTNDIDIVEDGLNIDGGAVITKNSDGSIQIGADGNDIDITSEGLTVDGVSLITKKDSGEIHIGKNSLITKEEDGVQKLYAQDEDGDAININVTNGSKLLIDGVEVTAEDSAQVTTNSSNISTNTSDISTNTSNIKNLGQGVAGATALTAALTALPQTSKESKLSCGVGTGAYSSRYAVGFGCASKVNERVDINAGGSYVFGGSKSYGEGTLDSGVVKAGFVFKLGELKKPTQISMKEKKELKKEISILKENNQNILAQNQTLLARLERLEKIALGESNSPDLAVYQLK